ncbi:MAG: cobalamin biosynthesis protein CobW [Proteobacteria bacterium]|nr:cobalamin biosynthesis protein CobW [Pseudomonadota bacterium]
MAEKIPATVITGFLGAGKTSLIRHMIEQNRGKRLAFLINEFGDLGIDRDVLLGCGIEDCGEDDIVELANGCICCTVADDFLPAMEKILGRETLPDHIIIETSGLALPKPLVKAFNWPEVRSRVTVDGVIAVVDSAAMAEGVFTADPAALLAARMADPALDHDDPLEEVFQDQLACADMVVMNKTDLVSKAAATVLRHQMAARIRPGAQVISAANARVDPAVLLGLGAGAEDDLDTRHSHHDDESDHDHDDFESFIITPGPIADADALEKRLRQAVAQHNILRMKGFLDRPGIARREVVQMVGPRLDRYFDREWRPDEERRSHIVVIGFAGLDKKAIWETVLG